MLASGVSSFARFSEAASSVSSACVRLVVIFETEWNWKRTCEGGEGSTGLLRHVHRQMRIIHPVTLTPVQMSRVVKIDTTTSQFIDEQGRTRFFRGVNVVYKQPPYFPPFEKFDPVTSFSEAVRKMGSLRIPSTLA